MLYDPIVPLPPELLDHLQARRDEVSTALDSLRACRQRVSEASDRLESARATDDYLDAFIGLLARAENGLDTAIGDADRVRARVTADGLRRLAAGARAEERRCREFSDRWVQKPLPHEEVRPLLTQMVSIVRHQLGRLASLEDLAARIEAAAPQVEGRFDRRALFERFTEPLRRRTEE